MDRPGTATFLQRFQLTEALQATIQPLLDRTGIECCEFGQHLLLGRNGPLEARLKQLKAKSSPAALVVKFAPDFLCMARDSKRLFFVDIKTSLTPVIFRSKLDEIAAQCGRNDIVREQVGVVEREAWDNYRSCFPADSTAILMASPYHPKVLVADWVGRIGLLYRYPKSVNPNAAGSQTPHVNIDLNSMRRIDHFLQQEFGLSIPAKMLDECLAIVKTWPLSNPGRPWSQFNACVRELQKTCPWLRQRDKSGFID